MSNIDLSLDNIEEIRVTLKNGSPVTFKGAGLNVFKREFPKQNGEAQAKRATGTNYATSHLEYDINADENIYEAAKRMADASGIKFEN